MTWNHRDGYSFRKLGKHSGGYTGKYLAVPMNGNQFLRTTNNWENRNEKYLTIAKRILPLTQEQGRKNPGEWTETDDDENSLFMWSHSKVNQAKKVISAARDIPRYLHQTAYFPLGSAAPKMAIVTFTPREKRWMGPVARPSRLQPRMKLLVFHNSPLRV